MAVAESYKMREASRWCGLAPLSTARFTRKLAMSDDIVFATIPNRKSFRNLTNMRFGRWTVIGYLGKLPVGYQGQTQCRWHCRCECGKEKSVFAKGLVRGESLSCGCLCIDAGRALRWRHGHASGGRVSGEYSCWCSMLQRCTDKNVESYTYYGARGITVCQRWYDFQEFLKDVGPRPSPRHSLDRFPDVNGNYEPGNVRWATPKEQSRNKRNNVTLTYNGETLTVTEWAERTGMDRHTIVDRLKRGMTDAEALTAPRKTGSRKQKLDGE